MAYSIYSPESSSLSAVYDIGWCMDRYNGAAIVLTTLELAVTAVTSTSKLVQIQLTKFNAERFYGRTYTAGVDAKMEREI